jgi:hypothetical protein
VAVCYRGSHKEEHGMGSRRRRKRRLKGRARDRGARPEKFVDVRVERNPKGSRMKSAKVTKRRRRVGNVTEESYEL